MVRAIEKGVVRDLLNKLAKYLGEGTSRKAAKGNFRCFSFFATLSFSCKRSTGGTVRAARLAAVEFLNGGQLETPYTSSPMSRLATFFEFQSRMAPPLSGDTICQQNRRKLSEIQRSFPEWDRSPVTAG
jgi:hypothetical protein